MPGAVEEVLLFFDRPAQAAIEDAATFLTTRGVSLTHRTAYSVAFAGGQFAAVPVQLKPDWCRVWLTVQPESSALSAAEAFVDAQREQSRRTGAAIAQLEQGIYDEARWPEYEAQVRRSLAAQRVPTDQVEARVAAFKQRWLALGRKTAAAPPEEPEPA